MNMRYGRNLHYINYLSYIFIIFIAMMPGEILARAGHHGKGGMSFPLGVVLLPFLIIYSAIITWMVRKKHKESRRLIESLSAQSGDLADEWNLGDLKARFDKVFFKVQEAWMMRDPGIAKKYMSERLYDKHKMQIDMMVQQRRVNVLENICLSSARIVEVADYHDDSKDLIQVYIEGSMIDYVRDEDTFKVISGKVAKAEDFSEIWKFVRDAKSNWVLDDIVSNIGIGDLNDLKSFSEELQS